MYELSIQSPRSPESVARLCLRNCDKDGAMVAARLASILGGVASSRPASIYIDRYTDAAYFRDMAARLVGYYENVESALLDRKTLVFGSAHPAALYVAEVLHGIFLPLQILSFSRTLEEAASTRMLSILGADHDVRGFWQWNKASRAGDIPPSYCDLMQQAERLVVVRSLDSGEDSPLLGQFESVYVNATLRRLYPDLWDSIASRLSRPIGGLPELYQWEWGLPDATIQAVKQVWDELHKPSSTFHVIEASSLALYFLIPRLWKAYLARNGVKPRGVTLNGYGTAHPVFERSAGLIPIHYYRFGLLRHLAARILHEHWTDKTTPKDCCIFANAVGGTNDVDEIQGLITDLDFGDRCWFSNGLDAPGAGCTDVFDQPVPPPSEKVAGWLSSTPYRNRTWLPMEVSTVM